MPTLVILSACNSGGPGGSTAGESLSGLARAFFYAGARALLVTHWSVNDQAAAFLVADTLRRLQAAPRRRRGRLRAARARRCWTAPARPAGRGGASVLLGAVRADRRGRRASRHGRACTRRVAGL